MNPLEKVKSGDARLWGDSVRCFYVARDCPGVKRGLWKSPPGEIMSLVTYYMSRMMLFTTRADVFTSAVSLYTRGRMFGSRPRLRGVASDIKTSVRVSVHSRPDAGYRRATSGHSPSDEFMSTAIDNQYPQYPRNIRDRLEIVKSEIFRQRYQPVSSALKIQI